MEVWMFSLRVWDEEGAGEMFLQGAPPQPTAASRIWIQQPGRLEGLKCTIPVKVQHRGWRQQSSKQLPAVPVVRTPEKGSAVMPSLCFLSLGGNKSSNWSWRKRKICSQDHGKLRAGFPKWRAVTPAGSTFGLTT